MIVVVTGREECSSKRWRARRLLLLLSAPDPSGKPGWSGSKASSHRRERSGTAPLRGGGGRCRRKARECRSASGQLRVARVKSMSRPARSGLRRCRLLRTDEVREVVLPLVNLPVPAEKRGAEVRSGAPPPGAGAVPQKSHAQAGAPRAGHAGARAHSAEHERDDRRHPDCCADLGPAALATRAGG